MNFYLAVDAGGTKTDYVLANETQELARVRTGTIKRMRTNHLTAMQNLDQALQELSFVSGIPLSRISRTCIGTAGETVPLVRDWLREALTQRVAGELILVGDVEIALDAAFPAQSGIVAIAGTGSNVAGRSPAGVRVNAGGWGPALADQGSGHRIGLMAVRAALLALDETISASNLQESSRLLPAILSFWQLQTVSDLVDYGNAMPPPDFSALTGIVLACADAGDLTAQQVLRREGESLGYLIVLVAKRIRAQATHPDWLPRLAFTGSILQKIEPVRAAVMAAVWRELPGIQEPAGVIDPIHGALWRARNG